MLCNHLALLLHQLRRDRVDQIEGDGKDGEGTVDTKSKPPDQLFVFAMPEILEHEEANGQARQGARQVSYIRDLGTLGKTRAAGIIHKVLGVQGIAQIAGNYKKEEEQRRRVGLVAGSAGQERLLSLSLSFGLLTKDDHGAQLRGCGLHVRIVQCDVGQMCRQQGIDTTAGTHKKDLRVDYTGAQ